MRIKITSATAPGCWYQDEIGEEYEVIDNRKTPNGWYWVIDGFTTDYAVHENDCIVIEN